MTSRPFRDIFLTLAPRFYPAPRHGFTPPFTDAGLTWTEPDIKIRTLNTCELPDKSVVYLDCWIPGKKQNHEISVYKLSSPDGQGIEEKKTVVELPFESPLSMRRSMIFLRDGRLLSCGYGCIEGEEKNAVHLLESYDKGETWNYLSSISGKNSPGDEGYNEPCLLELDNGDILCLMRTGGSLSEWLKEENLGPLVQSISADGGRTWCEPIQIANYGVAPHAIKLTDGTLVASAGRHGVYILVDFTGTGENWQKIDVYFGQGSSYTTLLELQPNKVMLIYDESEFCLNKGSNVLNRIMGLNMDIKKLI